MALDPLALEGDPLADQVITDLVATDSIAAVNAVLEHLRGNDTPIPADLPESVREYLIATDNPPDWADQQRIARAREFFVDDGVHVASVLSYGAMVNCYAQPRPSRLLRLTHRLDHPHRRLSETSQFVLHMMTTDPFGDTGSFVPTIQKTRLIHAAVRHFVAASGEWDAAADGVPICQQDLLGALMIFSVQVIQGMRRMGVEVTQAEAEDYYYVWRVAGSMLGIRTAIIPETLAEAEEFSKEQVESTYGPSPDGIALTKGLIELYEQLVPGKIFDGVVPAMVRQVVNPEVADWLEVPKSRGWIRFVHAATGLLRMSEHAEDSNKIARTVLDRAGQLLLGGSVRMLTSGETATLDIPADLRDRWSASGHCPAR
ncbi:MAG TPA: oxygenase MpaB family protein [Pseudonocardiaceae bacterium]|nr:oxygenase MpaB family protein [Pseudonocardiaceae bacterium]